MTTEQLKSIAQRIEKMMKEFVMNIEDYEEQYERIVVKKNNRKTIQLGRRQVNVETEFDELYEVVKKNEIVLKFEEEMNELMNEMIVEVPQYFNKKKEEKKELAMKNQCFRNSNQSGLVPKEHSTKIKIDTIKYGLTILCHQQISLLNKIVHK